MSIYLPREDSFLLQRYVKQYARGKVLDMGTGSGIQAITAASNKGVSVLAADFNEKAVDYCKKNIKSKKIIFRYSDLFSDIHEKFDTIVFNPPYLPEDEFKKDISVIGGRRGYETVERFLDSANNHLNTNGIILLLFSSLTKKEKVDEIIERNGLAFVLLDEKGAGLYEKLYVYLIKKSDLLKKLEKLKIVDVKKFTKGHRGIIYTGRFKGKKVAVKIQRPDVSVKTIKNEINCLKRLNKHKIGPKVIYSANYFFVYQFIEGSFIEDFIEKTKDKKIIKKVLKNVMLQCRTLDKLGLNKEEMHHPYKHVIVTKKQKAFLVDFERCRKTKDPKNVTQFCQYLISGKMNFLLKEKGIRIDREKVISLAKKYKKDFSEKSFREILRIIS